MKKVSVVRLVRLDDLPVAQLLSEDLKYLIQSGQLWLLDKRLLAGVSSREVMNINVFA